MYIRLNLILAVLTLASYGVFAQVMMPVTRTIQTPYGPGKITSYQYMGPSPRPFNLIGGNKTAYAPYVGKTHLTVVLKNDSVFNEKLFFNVTDSINSLTLDRKKRDGGDIVFYPKDTRQISQVYNGKMMVGIPSDSCWLFKVKPGAINAYAPLPTEWKEFYTAIQKGDGPIVPLTKDNLKEMVGDNPKLIKMVEKGKLTQVIWKYNGSK